MISRHRFLIAVVAACGLPALTVAQTPSPSTPPPAQAAAAPTLSLEACIARALDRNFDLQIQRVTTGQASEAVTIADAAFDPTLELSASTNTSQQPTVVSSIDGVSAAGLRNQSRDLRAGVSQKLSTGATVNASASLDRGESNSRNLFLNPAYTGDFNLSVRQPLLRGAGSEYSRASFRRAELGVDRANLDLKGSVLVVVRNVEAAYYNLVFARQQRGVRQSSLELAQQLLEENRARRQTGVATDLDVLQAEVGVANARRSLLLADQTVQDREDALTALIGQFEFNQTIGDVSFENAPVPAVSFDFSYKLARENQPALASSAIAIRQLEIDRETAKRNRLPDLGLGAGLGLNSREASYGDAATRTFDGDGYAWQVDLTLRVPWAQREDNARLRLAQSNIAREQTRLQQLDQNLVVEVRSAVRAVETNRESVAISGLATRLSERQYELERARFNAGLSTSRRVLEAQDDLEIARVNELQSQVNLRIALAELQRLEGSSLTRFRIVLDQAR
jgi:outer membrane protein TolC